MVESGSSIAHHNFYFLIKFHSTALGAQRHKWRTCNCSIGCCVGFRIWIWWYVSVVSSLRKLHFIPQKLRDLGHQWLSQGASLIVVFV